MKTSYLKQSFYTALYNACVGSCQTADLLCVAACSRTYQENVQKCPCQSGCPNGCPCDQYICPTTTTSTTNTITTTAATPKTEVLVLNSNSIMNAPIVTNAFGRQDTNFFFMMGENTEVRYSCGLTWRNQHFVFGGSVHKTQVSKINNCKLESVGQLTFYHSFGACANVADNQIYLCFNDTPGDYKKCRMSSSPTGTFEDALDSISEHRRIRISASERKIKLDFLS